MTIEQPEVIIAGHGQMGHAMETLLAGRARLHIWPVAPDRLEPPPAIVASAAAADFLLVCTPTIAHAAVLAPLAHRLPPGAAVLSIAKGLDDAGRCAADILAAGRGPRPWGVLGGPMIANEIIAGRVAYAELGSRDAGLYARTRALYPAAALHLVHTPDPQAVSWCGVLKNIYAPLIGVSDGLGWGDNARGHLVMAAIAEMQRLLQELAGPDAGAYGDAGLADFVTTVTSAASHHYALGRRIARGEYGDLECEGVHSLKVLLAGKRLDLHRHPLYAAAACLAEAPARLPETLHAWLAAG